MLYRYRRFIVYIKTDNIYKDITKDVETRFVTVNYELDRPLPKGKNKNVVGLMKDKLGGKIMTKFVELRAITYIFLINKGSEDRKSKDTIKCAVKRKIEFENYKNCFEISE